MHDVKARRKAQLSQSPRRLRKLHNIHNSLQSSPSCSCHLQSREVAGVVLPPGTRGCNKITHLGAFGLGLVGLQTRGVARGASPGPPPGAGPCLACGTRRQFAPGRCCRSPHHEQMRAAETVTGYNGAPLLLQLHSFTSKSHAGAIRINGSRHVETHSTPAKSLSYPRHASSKMSIHSDKNLQ